MALTHECEHKEAVYWNPYNQAVQCHKCGQIFVPKENEPQFFSKEDKEKYYPED